MSKLKVPCPDCVHLKYCHIEWDDRWGDCFQPKEDKKKEKVVKVKNLIEVDEGCDE